MAHASRWSVEEWSPRSADSSHLRLTSCSSQEHVQLWEQFVNSHTECTNYHRWNWKQVLEGTFGWATYYLMAMEGGSVRGILPLAFQRNWPSYGFVCSLPILSAGGIVAETPQAEEILLDGAKRLTVRLGARYLELRYQEKPRLDLPLKTNKVTLVLPVAETPEKMWKALSTKMRTKIRKAESYGLRAEFGGSEFLDLFYDVFSQNMRDLGTPAYSRKLFSEILRAFPNDTHLCVVRHGNDPVAASFLTSFRRKIEAKWSSSIKKFLPLKPNFFLYWKLLSFATKHGYQLFDFGRSTVGSGTHEFKRQWGAQTLPLHWACWQTNGGRRTEGDPHSTQLRIAIRVWQRLPLAFTRYLGPKIVKYFPS